MFTGIIQSVGTVTRVASVGTELQIAVKDASITKRVKKGSSVCVNGVCLTVVQKTKNTMRFDVSEETQKRTKLGDLKRNDCVNLEPSLHMGDELGGHFVFGHVDGVGRVETLEKNVLVVSAPKKIIQYMVAKGSVAVDGVSLTIIDVGKDWFSVALIPYTLAHTTVKNKKKGDSLHVEIDMLARYVTNIVNNNNNVMRQTRKS